MSHCVLSLARKINYILVSCLIGLVAPSVFAQTTPNTNTTINNKPISIDADNQQIDLKNNTITFTGNVIIIQDDLKIKASTVVITEMNSKDNQTITANGNPVYFEQINDNKQTITGHANQLIYQVKQNNVTMIGKAEIQQQDNHIVSDKIIYNVDQQKILAQSNKGNRVKTTILPNQVQEIKQ